MMCGTGDNWVEGMDGNGDSMSKLCEKTDFLTYVSASLAVLPARHTQLAGIFLILR